MPSTPSSSELDKESVGLQNQPASMPPGSASFGHWGARHQLRTIPGTPGSCLLLLLLYQEPGSGLLLRYQTLFSATVVSGTTLVPPLLLRYSATAGGAGIDVNGGLSLYTLMCWSLRDNNVEPSTVECIVGVRTWRMVLA